jgi:hypothetical protein
VAAAWAYLAGDGATASVALDRAHGADPGHRLAAILAAGLQAAVPPERFRTSVAALPTLNRWDGRDLPTGS